MTIKQNMWRKKSRHFLPFDYSLKVQVLLVLIKSGNRVLFGVNGHALYVADTSIFTEFNAPINDRIESYFLQSYLFI